MDRALEMQVFCTVVDKGTFVGAADALEMSKAAISRYVSALEERLGARLLHRTTRKLSLTEEGRQFYHQAREVLALMDQAEEAVSSAAPEPSGVLRVNAPVSFGVLHLAPLWGAFMNAHPNVELDISLNDRLVDLVDEGFDAAIRIARMESSSLVGRRLAGTRMCLCASPITWPVIRRSALWRTWLTMASLPIQTLRLAMSGCSTGPMVASACVPVPACAAIMAIRAAALPWRVAALPCSQALWSVTIYAAEPW